MHETDKAACMMRDKSVRTEFGITQDEIILGIRLGKLQHKENHMHGNPYFRLFRSEVEKFVTNQYENLIMMSGFVLFKSF